MLVFIAGVVMTVRFFIPAEASGFLKDFASDWLIIIGIFAMALGIYSLVRVSIAKIRRRSRDWQYSVLTLSGLTLMIIFGIEFPGVRYEPKIAINDLNRGISSQVESIQNSVADLTDTVATPAELAAAVPELRRSIDSLSTFATAIKTDGWYELTPEQSGSMTEFEQNLSELSSTVNDLEGRGLVDTAAVSAYVTDLSSAAGGLATAWIAVDNVRAGEPFIGGQASYMFRRFFNHIMIPIQATMFSLLAFFIASAAYRAFRARSILATVLLLAAMALMLRLIPFGGGFGTFLNDLASWILLVPNLAAKRAILIGVGLGMVATAMKVVLGIERGYLGRD
jgi:hypothetical protein